MGTQRLIAATLIALCACMYSCSRSQSGGGGKTEISFWTFWSEPSQQAALKKLVAGFEQAHPGIAVRMTGLSWNDGKAKLLAAFNSGEPPDALELGSDWVAQFSSSGVLADLTPKYLADTAQFVPFSCAPALWNGKLFALPWVVDTRVMFYNKTLMSRAGLDTNAPPATWDELNGDCAKIAALGGGVYGFGANASDAHRLYKKILPFFWAEGGCVLGADGKRCFVNSPANVAALAEYLQLARCGVMETQKRLDALFAQGKIGFWISGGWLVEKIRNENPSLRYGVALMPQPAPKVGTRASFAGGEYLAVSAAAKRADAAATFIRYLADGGHTLPFCKQVAEAGYPADKRYFADTYFTGDPIRSVFIEQLRYARMTPVHPQWLDIEKIIEDEVSEAMYGRKSARAALDDAQKEIASLLEGSRAE